MTLLVADTMPLIHSLLRYYAVPNSTLFCIQALAQVAPKIMHGNTDERRNQRVIPEQKPTEVC